jgi:hypothetical protein
VQLILLLVTVVLVLHHQLLVHLSHGQAAAVAALRLKRLEQDKVVAVTEQMEIPLLLLALLIQAAVGVEVDMQVVLEVLAVQAAQA